MIYPCDDCGQFDWMPLSLQAVLDDLDPQQRDLVQSFFASGEGAQAYQCMTCGLLGFTQWATAEALEDFVGKHPGGCAAAGAAASEWPGKE